MLRKRWSKYLHDNWVLHRDLKTSNILLNNCGELKICDFGLARQYGSPLKPYTQLVVTLWYRAPELLLGAKQYSTSIDMWSLGCIMAELLSKKPLFNGKSEIEQIDKIFRTLGTPNETIWPGYSKLPGVKANFVKNENEIQLIMMFTSNLLRKKFPSTSFTWSPVLSDAGFDLLNKLLTYDPESRITVEAALDHQWFREVPLPKAKEFMPTFPAQHAQDRHRRSNRRVGSAGRATSEGAANRGSKDRWCLRILDLKSSTTLGFVRFYLWPVLLYVMVVHTSALMNNDRISNLSKKIIENLYMLGTMAGGVADCQFWHINLGIKGYCLND
ncbi:hypothetical protein Leryth_009913 [Lithospermum erythrorhizon]|nr:hypothetical protein Leryth_009913 [Lithospermum erythrorhizon]